MENEEQQEEEKRQKLQEMQQTYEKIIILFTDSTNGLKTKEVYDAMVEQHGYANSLKTIENYLKDLVKGVVPGVMLTWVNRKKHQLEDFRDAPDDKIHQHMEKLHSKKVLYGEEKAYMRLAMESIRKLDTLSSKHHQEIEKRLGLKGMEDSPYFIDNEDMESVDMSNADIIYLKEAIEKDAIAEFRYVGKSSKDWYVIEPYKLIIFDGLWYLFGKDTINIKNPYKTWRLIYITDVDYDRSGKLKHKMDDSHSESILQQADDANFVVDIIKSKPVIRKNITVTLKIASDIAESFDHEAHIPGVVSQPVKQEDGSFILHTKVNTLKDVDAEIKSWLPYIEVLEPEEYRVKVKEELTHYLKNLA